MIAHVMISTQPRSVLKSSGAQWTCLLFGEFGFGGRRAPRLRQRLSVPVPDTDREMSPSYGDTFDHSEMTGNSSGNRSDSDFRRHCGQAARIIDCSWQHRFRDDRIAGDNHDDRQRQRRRRVDDVDDVAVCAARSAVHDVMRMCSLSSRSTTGQCRNTARTDPLQPSHEVDECQQLADDRVDADTVTLPESARPTLYDAE